MRQKPAGRQSSSEHIIKDIKRKTHKRYSAEEKIRIVLDGSRRKGTAGDKWMMRACQMLAQSHSMIPLAASDPTAPSSPLP